MVRLSTLRKRSSPAVLESLLDVEQLSSLSVILFSEATDTGVLLALAERRSRINLASSTSVTSDFLRDGMTVGDARIFSASLFWKKFLTLVTGELWGLCKINLQLCECFLSLKVESRVTFFEHHLHQKTPLNKTHHLTS